MFGKLYASTYTGSMFGAGMAVFAVWGWILANADRDNNVEINPELVAAMLGGTVDEVEKSVEFLLAPDPRSRSQDADGRRLVHLGGMVYEVVNRGQYRQQRDADERKRQNREAQARRRKKVSEGSSGNQPIKITDTDTDTDNRDQKPRPKMGRPKIDPKPEAIEAAQYLYDAIKSHSPGFLGSMQPAAIERKLHGWAKDIDRAMRLDGLTADKAKIVIDEAHRSPDPFWRSNLLSGAKLRKHAESLLIRAQGRKGPPPGATDYVGAAARWESFLAGGAA